MQHQVAPFVRRLLATAALGALSSVAAAGTGQLVPDIELTLGKPLYEAGEVADITICGEAGDVPLLLVGFAPGSAYLPGVGDLGIALEPLPWYAMLPPLDGEGKLTVPCMFDCPLVQVPFFLQAITISPKFLAPTGLSNVEVLQVAGADCGACPTPAEAIVPCVHESDHAITLPGIGTDFVFVAGASFVERGDGTASITGVVARLSNADERFFVEVDLSDRIGPLSMFHPPAGSPKLELCDESYKMNGGPIRPELWHYYDNLEGRLTGMGDLHGAIVDVYRMGPAAQVGRGANGKNLNYGLSTWLSVQVIEQPDSGQIESSGKGDINIDLDGECVDCPFPAEIDAYYMYGGGHALWLPGIGTDFVFEDGATYEEFGDGTAKLTGTAVSLSDSDARLDVEFCYSGRVNPGSDDYPPADSPKKELKAEAYSENGGPVDTDNWHYYTTLLGSIEGLDNLSGLTLDVSDRGPAFQVGIGASGKNVLMGASGWLGWTLVSQPDSGPEIADEGKGDVNIDLDECPEDDGDDE